jgi:hypothetical protein
MLIDIDFARDASQFAPRMDDAPDDHGQGGANPRLLPGIEQLVEFELAGQLEQSVAGAVGAGGENLKGVGRVERNDVPAESGLDQLELSQGEAGDAAVIGVVDLAVEAEGGTDEAVMVFAGRWDFQVEIGGREPGIMLVNGYILHRIGCRVNIEYALVWLPLKWKKPA